MTSEEVAYLHDWKKGETVYYANKDKQTIEELTVTKVKHSECTEEAVSITYITLSNGFEIEGSDEDCGAYSSPIATSIFFTRTDANRFLLSKSIYDFMLDLSAYSFQNELKKSDEWKNWHSCPQTKKDFCKFFNLSDDDRVKYTSYERGSYLDIYCSVDIHFDNPIGNVTYNFGFAVSGYSNPYVQYAHIEPIKLEFGRKYFPPCIKKPEWHQFISYNDMQDLVDIDITDKTTVGMVVKNYQDTFSKLNAHIDRVLKSFYDGSYEAAFKKFNVPIHQNNYESRGLGFPNFYFMVNTLFYAKEYMYHDISIEDAVMLHLYVAYKYTRSQNIYDKLKKLLGCYGKGISPDDFETFKKELADIIEIKTGFAATLDNANKYVLSKLDEAIKEASEKFGIASKYICLSGFSKKNSYKMFSAGYEDAPKDWKIKQN